MAGMATLVALARLAAPIAAEYVVRRILSAAPGSPDRNMPSGATACTTQLVYAVSEPKLGVITACPVMHATRPPRRAHRHAQDLADRAEARLEAAARRHARPDSLPQVDLPWKA